MLKRETVWWKIVLMDAALLLFLYLLILGGAGLFKWFFEVVLT